jgi:hypothetical protein
MTTNNNRVPDMVARLEAGATLEEVGAIYNITRERARQITKGLYDRDKQRAARKNSQLSLVDMYKEEILEDWFEGKPILQIAHELGLPCGYTEQRLHEWIAEWDPLELARRRARAISNSTQKISDEEILAIIRFIAEQEGHAPSLTDYDRWREHFSDWPSKPTLSRGDKSFNDWVRQAGFTPNDRPKGMGLPTFDDAQVFAALNAVSDIVGHFPSMREYTKNRPDGAISDQGIRRKFGTWTNAMEALINYNAQNPK